jgi:hypothetical protein
MAAHNAAVATDFAMTLTDMGFVPGGRALARAQLTGFRIKDKIRSNAETILHG